MFGTIITLLTSCLCLGNLQFDCTQETACAVWISLTVLCCPLLLSGTIVKNCISCSVELLHFLFVHSFKTVFLVHELDTEDQQIGHQVICCLEVAPKKKSVDQNQENLRIGNNKFEISLLLFLFTSYGTVLSLCPPSCGSVCKVLGPVVKCNRMVLWVLKWCKNCSNITFCLGDTALWLIESTYSCCVCVICPEVWKIVNIEFVFYWLDEILIMIQKESIVNHR